MRKCLIIIILLCFGQVTQASTKGAIGVGVSTSFGGGAGVFASYSLLFGSIGISPNGFGGWQAGIIGLDKNKSNIFGIFSYGVVGWKKIPEHGYVQENLYGPCISFGYNWMFYKKAALMAGFYLAQGSYSSEYGTGVGVGGGPTLGLNVGF